MVSSHRWYDKTHVPQVRSVEGSVSVRGLVAYEGSTFPTTCEIDGEQAKQKPRFAYPSFGG